MNREALSTSALSDRAPSNQDPQDQHNVTISSHAHEKHPNRDQFIETPSEAEIGRKILQNQKIETLNSLDGQPAPDASEILRDPSLQFRVDPKSYPIFNNQGHLVTVSKMINRPLDDTLSDYVRYTADTIAVITGETDDGLSDNAANYPAPVDHVIYLDKSARPVCWLVNSFWDDFTNAKRPPHSFLAIDRVDWFRRAGLKSDQDGRDIETGERLTFSEFQAREDHISLAELAGIHALYVEGGVNTVGAEEIMNFPTKLDGKRVLVIDEVSRTGSTVNIAKTILKRAIPNIGEIETYQFYQATGLVTNPQTGEKENAEVPVWYRQTPEGRGIGDPNERFFETRYQNTPTPKTLAQRLGSYVLGAFINLGNEEGQPSRELAKEIQQMRQDFDQGKILFSTPQYYSIEKWADWIDAHHMILAPADEFSKKPKNSYVSVKEAIAARKHSF